MSYSPSREYLKLGQVIGNEIARGFAEGLRAGLVAHPDAIEAE